MYTLRWEFETRCVFPLPIGSSADPNILLPSKLLSDGSGSSVGVFSPSLSLTPTDGSANSHLWRSRLRQPDGNFLLPSPCPQFGIKKSLVDDICRFCPFCFSTVVNMGTHRPPCWNSGMLLSLVPIAFGLNHSFTGKSVFLFCILVRCFSKQSLTRRQTRLFLLLQQGKSSWMGGSPSRRIFATACGDNQQRCFSLSNQLYIKQRPSKVSMEASGQMNLECLFYVMDVWTKSWLVSGSFLSLHVFCTLSTMIRY